MSEIRAELQRAVDEALRSASIAGPPPSPGPERPAPRQRRGAIVAIAASVALLAGVGAWALTRPDQVTVITGTTDAPSTTVPRPKPPPRAISFTLDMPERFSAGASAPERRRREATWFPPDDWDPTATTTTSSPRPMVDELVQNWIAESVTGAVEESLIIELSYVEDLPDGFLEFYFEGEDIANASAERPLVQRGPANRSGGHYANWLDGTHYVMFIADGMTQTEFDTAVDSFTTQG
jgi:hypothetical protein